MKRLLNILFLLLLTLAPVGRVWAEVNAVQATLITAADGTQYTQEQMDSLRNTEDFVRASLVIADPSNVLYSVLGHAAIRLQCPMFGLDNVYSYESEDATRKVIPFLAGKLMMGLRAIPTGEYCAVYAEDGRGVKEYEMNLNPLQKQELWRVMDVHLHRGTDFPYDYYHHGCANSCVQLLHEALGDTPIQYAPWPKERPSGRDLVYRNTENALWARFLWFFVAGNEADQPLRGDKQLMIPKELAEVWQTAMIDGHPLLSSEVVLVTGNPRYTSGWFTPNVAFCILLLMLLLTVVGKYVLPENRHLLLTKEVLENVVMGIVTIGAIVEFYLIVISNLCCTDWNWLFIPFNPVVCLIYYFRNKMSEIYLYVCSLTILILIGWMIGIILYEHVLADTPHLLLVASEVVVLIGSIIKNNKYKISLIKSKVK